MNPMHDAIGEDSGAVSNLNFHYEDPHPPSLEHDMVIKLGRRYRRRRNVTRMASAASSLAAVLAVSTCSVSSGPTRSAPAASNPEANLMNLQLVKDYPPLTTVSNLGTLANGVRVGWSELTWLSAKELCYGIADLSGTGLADLHCVPISGVLAPQSSQPAVFTPFVTPDPPDTGRMLVFGYVRGNVYSVTVSAFGIHTAVPSLIPIVGSQISAYAVFIPTGGGTGIDSQELTTVGRSASGDITGVMP